MGNLLVVVGVIYAVALLIQMLSYKQCMKKASSENAKEELETSGVVAGQGCY